MLKARKFGLLAIAMAVVLVSVWRIAAGGPSLEEQRTKLTKAYNDGNFKAAYDGLRALALDPKNDPTHVGKDLELAINALYRLGRTDEVDEFREAVIKVHEKNWRLLSTAARTPLPTGGDGRWAMTADHHGFMVAGKFLRGDHRGGGHMVNSLQRDRTRALQLMQQALNNIGKENDKVAIAQFHLSFANTLLVTGYQADAWRLQYLTDLTKLPDYDEGRWWDRNRNHNGAPVDSEGNAILHKVPKSYADAKTDGERWRWMLSQAVEFDSNLVNETDMIFGDFMKTQLGVQTMAYYGWRFGNIDEQNDDKKTGTFALHSLKETETIARLATGLKRLTITDEYNWIKIYQRVADRARTVWGEQALGNLAQDFEDRRKYPKAADYWPRAIKEYGPGQNQWRQQRLDQIVKNWGRFENVQSQAAGHETIVDFRFRNGDKVVFEAHAVNVPKLLDDVKAYLAANPGNRIDYNMVNLGQIGYRLVEQNQVQYLMGKVANWTVDLKPRPNHIDNRVSLKTPLTKAGAYLLTAQMANGNVSRVLVWVNDSVIVKKMLDGRSYYFVADANTGEPIDGAKLEFFGWKQEQVAPNTNNYRVVTAKFNDAADKDGQLTVGQDKAPQGFQWLITAKGAAGKNTPEHFAFLGFTHIWYGRIHDPEYNQEKTFIITDRPVYRPEQTAQFKCWVEHAKYDQPNVSSFAGQTFTVLINNPMNEKVLRKEIIADEFGGIAGELFLPKETKLGVYSLQVVKMNGEKIVHYYGGNSFRVEEYKKPEFEVKVNAPTEPVKLGDKITATIEAKYYFGAPVVNATVKYKVMRENHTARWYPTGRWDWFYGSGYWWFAADYDWFPGFGEWGCRRPVPSWYGMGRQQPELVIENEVKIGPDGKVEVVIDTQMAKELHGNQDHKYSITAEVTDQSRRTIVGTGNVLVSRKPFKVYTWLDKGQYRADDTIKAHFKAQTLDQKPVAGVGELTLYSISYNNAQEPVEKAVETWKLDTNVEGQAIQQIKAAKPGQYRLSYKVTDAKQNTIEGGTVVLVIGQAFVSSGFRFNDIELTADKKEYEPGEKAKLLINVNKDNGTVLLFPRPTNGVYLAPKVLRLKGKTIEEEIAVVQRDMPNFFVEVLTIADNRVHTETRELVVPPEKRVVKVEVVASQQEYKPGQKATVKLKLTDNEGKPFVGSTVVSVYDKSVEYIAGGSNVPEIKEFFWKWRRHHYPQTESSLHTWSGNLFRRGEHGMNNLGVFGATVVEEFAAFGKGMNKARQGLAERELQIASGPKAMAGAPGGFGGGQQLRGALAQDGVAFRRDADAKADRDEAGGGNEPQGPEPTVRKNFVDTAFWTASLTANKDGLDEVSVTTPAQLTAWKIRVWSMGLGTRVGQGETEFVTKKDLIVRLQAPRFFVQKDEVVLSANIHNYLKTEKKIRVMLEFDGGTLAVIEPPPPPIPNASFRAVQHDIIIKAGGEQRVDWRVKVINEGEALIRVKAITDVDSDAMEMRFPCFVHGMLKMDSFTGVIPPRQGFLARSTSTSRPSGRVNDSILEVRYSPTLAGAMVVCVALFS